MDGIKVLDGEYRDFAELTTPQLHYMVRCLNTVGTPLAYGEPNEDGYYKKLGLAYHLITVRGNDCVDMLTCRMPRSHCRRSLSTARMASVPQS
jgi:hypothetical protein